MLLLLLALARADTTTWDSSSDFAAGTTSGLTVSAGGLSVTASSSWYSTSWSWRMPIDIEETSGSTQTDYTLLVELDTASLISAGYLSSSGADLRFTTESGTLLDHWVESGLSSGGAQIWVQIPTITASSTTRIYLYMGNSSASDVGSHANTFLYWDDFSSSSISDYTRRGLDGRSADTWTIASGWLSVTATAGYSAALVTGISLSDGYEVETSAYTNDDDGIGIVGNVNAAGTGYYSARGWPSVVGNNGITGGDSFASMGYAVSSGTTYTYAFRKSGSRLEMLVDGDSVAVGTHTSPLTGTSLGVFSYQNSPGAYFDYIQVRRYVYPEPSPTAGEVEGLYDEGIWTSAVVDSGCADTRWTELRWTESLVSGSDISFEVRTGPSASPDSSWTDWTTMSASGADPDQGGRYAQVRATLAGSTSGTPTLSAVELDYALAEDLDLDGHDALACGGEDCDDADALVGPGATETCDGLDDDCDGETDEDDAADAPTWYADADGDGHGGETSATACSAPDGYVDSATDCADDDSARYPGATETCDGLDEDCDGETDEGLGSTWYADADGDGYGAGEGTVACEAPEGASDNAADCDDADGSVYPGAEDTPYDGVDQDCAEDGDYDLDQDGFDSDGYGGEDCDDADAEVNPDAAETWYDGIDQDCDDASDYDSDGDGHDSESYGGDDCDDADDGVFPGAPDEHYDGIVSDCDEADEYDADGDGHDSESYGGDDCDDARSDTYPGATEDWYDGIDQDCDDNDADQDEDGVIVTYDCDDTNAAVSPEQAEVDDNGVDDDCDGQVDLPDDKGAEVPCGCGAGASGWQAALLAALALAGARRRPVGR